MAVKFKTGTYTGTGAVINLALGFIPDFFVTVNITDGTPLGMWFTGMTADTGIDIAAAVASNANNAFTTYTGAVGSASTGISIGTDYSTSAKVYRYVALAA
jgi:hypothetical protein